MAVELTLKRDRAEGLLGGVCAGLAERYGFDVRLVRIVFVVGAAVAGIAVAVYALAWAVLPAQGERRVRLPARRAELEVAAGTLFLVLAALLLLRTWGLWVGDGFVWPIALVAAGAALIWRQSGASLPAPAFGGIAVGALLVLGGGLVFLWLNDALEPARDAVLAIVVIVLAGVAILAPFWMRLVRGLSAERAARIRSQERAEVAAHLHDSVLQTLALMQKRADDPRAVATLARRQERELRAWLNQSGPADGTLAGALQAAAAEVEEAHGAVVEVVTVGDRALDPATEAVAAAAREALTNAAKFAPDAGISLYAEMGDDRVEVFVRDRGPGFDPEAVPPDRRGLRESVVGRMQRHGGSATVNTAPGAGTEVELTL